MINPNRVISQTVANAMLDSAASKIGAILAELFPGAKCAYVIIENDEERPILLTYGGQNALTAVLTLQKVVSNISSDVKQGRDEALAAPIGKLTCDVPQIGRKFGDLLRILKKNANGTHQIAFEDNTELAYEIESHAVEEINTSVSRDSLPKVRLLEDFCEFKAGEIGHVAFDGALSYQNPPISFDSNPMIAIGVPAAKLEVL